MSFIPEKEIEIIVEHGVVLFSWSDEVIQELALELGETEFPESRPCG